MKMTCKNARFVTMQLLSASTITSHRRLSRHTLQPRTPFFPNQWKSAHLLSSLQLQLPHAGTVTRSRRLLPQRLLKRRQWRPVQTTPPSHLGLPAQCKWRPACQPSRPPLSAGDFFFPARWLWAPGGKRDCGPGTRSRCPYDSEGGPPPACLAARARSPCSRAPASASGLLHQQAAAGMTFTPAAAAAAIPLADAPGLLQQQLAAAAAKHVGGGNVAYSAPDRSRLPSTLRNFVVQTQEALVGKIAVTFRSDANRLKCWEQSILCAPHAVPAAVLRDWSAPVEEDFSIRHCVCERKDTLNL